MSTEAVYNTTMIETASAEYYCKSLQYQESRIELKTLHITINHNVNKTKMVPGTNLARCNVTPKMEGL
jgi:hypothetical protein